MKNPDFTPMLLSLYKTVLNASTPLIEKHLKNRAARGREDPARANERHGKPARPRGAGPLVWFHAASVGESVALLSTVARLLKDHPFIQVMVTTGTVTSAKTMAERLPEGAFHQYIPVDHPAWVAAFLDHWRPDLVVWTESDFWPAMLMEVAERKIPAVLLNGCMSQESFRKWRWGRALIIKALSAFDLVLAQNEGHAERLAALGARNVRPASNLKYAAAPLPFDAAKLDALKAAVGGRPLIVWGSAHPGEDAMAGRVHAALKKKHADLLTVIVPRHIAKAKDMQAGLEALGLKASLRSEGAMPGPGDDIYIADTMGEMGLFYRLGKLAIVGGSYCFRSHNPIEPAQLGCVVFYGPVTAHIEGICTDFESRGAALCLKDEAALLAKISEYLDNPAAFVPMAKAAEDWTRAKSGAVDEVAAALAPFVLALAEPGRKAS
jgi:3-deoxy-D-manno-octulosonic-acid transferase